MMRGCSSTAAATSFKVLAASAATGREGGRGGVLCSRGSRLPEIKIGSLRVQGLGYGGGGGGGGTSSRGNLSRLVILGRNPISPVACSSSPSSESQVELESAVDNHPQLLDQDDSRMVRIKMQLQKECEFGEHFLVVGAHPALGSWNPLDAVPMTWSAGHVWTAELDIPLGESLQFKFILRKITGEFLWQPGQDRVFHTWETSNIIRIFEDWDDAEAQHATEEQVLHKKCKESDELMNSEIEQLKQSHEKYSEEQEPEIESYEASESANSVFGSSGQIVAIVADNITHHTDPDMSRMGSSSIIVSEEEISTFQDGAFESEKPPFHIVSNSITSQMEKNVEISGNDVVAKNIISHNIKDLITISDKSLMTSENSVELKEAPVLVPSLSPCSTLSNEDVTAEEEQVEVELHIYDKDTNAKPEEPVLDQKQEEVEGYQEKEEAKGSLMFNDEHPPMEHSNELVFNDTEEANDKPDQDLESALFDHQSETESQNDLESSLWHEDIKWGKKTLKRILDNLGFF